MAYNDSRSVAELRRESERTRAELTQTVDILRTRINDTAADIKQKVSPEHIKAEVSDYVAETGRHWLDTLKQQAMENPMQALAAGTAIAMPAFKLVRSVPLPLLMIGAGLALTSPRVRRAVAEKVSGSFEATGAGDVIDDAVGQAREGWRTAKARTEDAIDDARTTVSDKVAQASDTAQQMAGTVKQRAAELGDAARETLSSASTDLSSKVNAASEAARDALETTKSRVAETVSATRASAKTVVRDNAALVGGIGLAIGALIAASLPSTKAESATLGAAADTLRKQAADAASGKFDELKGAAMSAAESAVDKVAEAGLGERMSRAADDAAEKLKTVTEDTITTAFEPSQSSDR
jgi:gas vesicle protein